LFKPDHSHCTTNDTMKTLYGRDLNSVLRDNLGDSWEEACSTLMCEMRMYELECLRRRMEDAASSAAARQAESDNNSLLSSIKSPGKSPRSPAKSSQRSPAPTRARNGSARMVASPEALEQLQEEEEEDRFTGHSCLLITWKTNPEVENFKELYMETEIKTHKRKTKQPVDPGDLVSEKSLQKNYKIIGKGEGLERLLVKGKKNKVEEVDGDPFRYFLLAGQTHPYPDDTFYSVGRVPRKLLMKYLGIKMYLVRLKEPPPKVATVGDRKTCADIAQLMLHSAGVAAHPAPSLAL